MGVACRTRELGYFHHERLTEDSVVHVRIHDVELPLQRTPMGGKAVFMKRNGG